MPEAGIGQTFGGTSCATRSGGWTARLQKTALAGLSVMLAATASAVQDFTGGTLTVTATDDDVFITGGGGIAAVNGVPVADAALVERIVVNGGPDANNIDLTQVEPNSFTALTSVTINGGGGADSIFGSQLADTIIDPDGGDTFNDTPGNDTYIVHLGGSGTTLLDGIGLGGNTLIIEGSAGADVIHAGPTQATSGGQTIVYSGIAQLTLLGGDGDDVFVVQSSADFPILVNGQGGVNGLAFDNEGQAVIQTDGSIAIAGKQPVNFASIASVSNCNQAGAADANLDGVPDGCEQALSSGGDNTGGDNTTGGNNTGGSDTGGSSSGGSTGGTSTGGSSTTTSGDNAVSSGGDSGSSGGDDSAATPAEVEEVLECGAGLCGAGTAQLMPMLLLGLCGAKMRMRSRRQ